MTFELDQILILLSLVGLTCYGSWIFFTINNNLKGAAAMSALMFIIVLFLLWRVFRLNLDFGLILFLATIFAVLSWLIGIALNLKNLISESKSYFWILLLILSIRSFAYEPYQIPSSSMVPGLQIGDFVLVNKYAYGLKLPVINKLVVNVREPKRGEVGVFLPPHTLCDSSPEEARPELASIPVRESQVFLNKFLYLQKDRCTYLGIKYIKRIIGVPGDKVEIRGEDLFINGNKLNRKFIIQNKEERFYSEQLDNLNYTVRYLGLKEYENYVWEIPPNKYLAIGDNRDNSLDSRDWGYFSKEHLIGRGEFIWMHWGSFSELPTFKRNRRIK
tara:strand:- start:2293 stop:3285 length:993 start_codon:yes stop_codon:yes gene_type:complete